MPAAADDGSGRGSNGRPRGPGGVVVDLVAVRARLRPGTPDEPSADPGQVDLQGIGDRAADRREKAAQLSVSGPEREAAAGRLRRLGRALGRILGRLLGLIVPGA